MSVPLPQALTPALREAASRLVTSQARWPAGSFEIALADGWRRGNPTLLMAHPVNRPYSIPIAVMPNGDLVTPFDRKGFERIVRECYPRPLPGEARDLVRLAVAFGNFGARIGQLCDDIPGSVRGSVRLPRDSAEVSVKTTSSGSTQLTQLRFYTMDHELGHLYDCEVRIDPQGVRLSARRISP